MAGKDGLNGQDGFGLEDFSAEQTGERTWTLRFARGDLIREHTIKLPAMIWRGVYSEKAQYEAGDAVTSGGSQWLATKDAPQGKPDERSSDWKLVVKRGRDGKDGKDGERGPPGAKGDPGRDLTALTPDGSKYR
jgi:integrin beta 3